MLDDQQTKPAMHGHSLNSQCTPLRWANPGPDFSWILSIILTRYEVCGKASVR